MTTKEKILTNFAEAICPEITLIFNNEDDSYYQFIENIISVDPNPKDDDGFLRHLAKVHKCDFAYDYPLILWTILHEIGHHFTLDDVIEDDIEARILCAMIPIEVARNNEQVQDIYYNLTSEWVATEWAIDFIATNREMCNELATLLA